MRKTLFALCIVVSLLSLTSCEDEGMDVSFKIAGININGVKYLALGSPESGSKGADVQSMLYSVDENGNMQVVAYEYDCDENGLVTELSRNITLSINQIVPVGDNYIWLVGCRYVCNDYSGFSEDMQDRIRGMVEHSAWSDIGENFLIRKSDGKIFDLNEAIRAFPIRSFSIPGYGSIGVVCNGDFPIDGDITGDKLRKLGLINQVGHDIYLASGSWQGGLSCLRDNGSTLSLMNVYPANFAYAITDNDGHLGTCIGYTGNHSDVAAIMAPDGSLPAIQGLPVPQSGNDYEPEMRCIGGKFFVSLRVDPWDGDSYDSIYLVDVSSSPATATAVAKGYFTGDEYETYSTTIYVSDDDSYTWPNGTSLYTFNANSYQLTVSTLPAGWPQYSLYDAEGRYYESHLGNRGLQSFTIYTLSTLQTEEVTCDRSQVPAFNFLSGCGYDGGLDAFVESVIMADASTATIVTPVIGPDRGISHIESQTGSNNNVVVSTLIPLN